MEEKRKLRLIVLDGEVTVDDLVKLKQGGFFEGLMVFEVPEGLRGQMATMGVPAAESLDDRMKRMASDPAVIAATKAGIEARMNQPENPVKEVLRELAQEARAGLPPGPPQYLTPLEATAFGWFEQVPADVLSAYADGAVAVPRAYPEERIATVFKAYKAVQEGKRTEEQGRAWWKASAGGTVQPSATAPATPPPAKAPDAVLPAEPRSYEDAQVIELLNTRKYLRQIVSDLWDIGITTRDGLYAACEKLKDRVPRIAAEGVNLRTRVDQSLSAIGH